MQHVDLNTYIPILLGGALTLIGGIAGTYFTQFITQKSEERKIKRERIEEIYNLATKVYYWLYAPPYDKLKWETSSLYRSYYRSEPTKEPKQDIERIKLLVNLYFVSLEDVVREYDLYADLVILAMEKYEDDNNEEELNQTLISFQKCYNRLQTQLKRLSGQKNAQVRYTPMPKPLQR